VHPLCPRLFAINASRAAAAVLACALAACGVREDAAGEAAEPAAAPPIAEAAFADPGEPVAAEEPFVHDKSPQVTILLYHEFSPDDRATDMVIPVARFREQMQMIKDSGVAVISVDQFLAWRRGESNIPDPSVMITMDDGWRSVHTGALPVLREFGYPFTVFLYTNYIAAGSKSLTLEQIAELVAAGATIGCHSRSHPYPAKVKAELAKGPEAAATFLRREMVETADIIEQRAGVRPKLYAYPAGFYTAEMFPIAEEAGYEAMFTVNPAKNTWETPLRELHRYVVHGNLPSTFEAATTFRGVPLGRKLMDADGKELMLATTPPDGATITDRQPLLSADLSPVPDLDPDSLILRVSGLGRVAHQFDPGSNTIRFPVPVRLRGSECSVFVYWKRLGSERYDSPLVWKFSLDRVGSLLGDIPPPPAGARRPPPMTLGRPPPADAPVGGGDA
jgi:peptidoglycan/xylan/chitin deacetylase (PgdA/CDA1 family)